MGLNHSPSIVTNGLVLCLDAANTKSYTGSGTTWKDLSGNGYNGTLTNGPTFDPSNGGSIVFDGVDDYVATTHAFTTRPFTINCWVYFTSLVGWQTIAAQDTSQSTQLAAFYFQKTRDVSATPRINNTVGIAVVTASNAEIYCYDPTPVASSVWYNYCISVSASGLTLYRNGIQVNTVANTDVLATPTGNTVIGAGYYNNVVVDFCKARIPQLSVYNRALSATEVQQNFNALKGRYGL